MDPFHNTPLEEKIDRNVDECKISKATFKVLQGLCLKRPHPEFEGFIKCICKRSVSAESVR